MRLTLRRDDGAAVPAAPARRAAAVCAGVVAATLFVFAAVTFIAPMLATHPAADLSAEELDAGAFSDSSLVVPRLRTGLDEQSVSPDPVATGLLLTPDARTAAAGTPGAPSLSPTLQPVRLTAAMSVSARQAEAGEHLIYEVTIRNMGQRRYSGAFTVNLHTPEGTVRCEADNRDLCFTPGDYDGSSKNPNDPHTNPDGVTRSTTIKPGRTKVLVRLEVVVAATTGTVLHNHAHVDGVGRGDRSVTVDSRRVGADGLPEGGARASAPDVLVL